MTLTHRSNMEPCLRQKRKFLIDVDFDRPSYEKSYLKHCYLSDLKIIAIEMNIYPDDNDVFCSSRTRAELIRDITKNKLEESEKEYECYQTSEEERDYSEIEEMETEKEESSSEEHSSNFYDDYE